MSDRPTWDEYHIAFAKVAATRSQCLRAHHGAVIVDSDHRILSTGYNNPPPGIASCEERGDCTKVHRPDYGPSCRGTLHAEDNALRNLRSDRIRDAVRIYITGTPCNACLEDILKHGIKDIVCAVKYTPASGSGNEERGELLAAFGGKLRYMDTADE